MVATPVTLQEEIAQAISDGFSSCGAATRIVPSGGTTKVFVEGFNKPITVLDDDVIVPIPPFSEGHATGIGLDVAAILASR